MFNPGIPELVVLAAIGLLLFGKKLPDLARMLGKTIVEFRRQASGGKEDFSL